MSVIARGVPQTPREDGVRIVNTRWGLRHAFPQGNGTFVVCSGSQSSCVLCRTEGIPRNPEDPFDVTAALLLKYGDQFWYSSNRTGVHNRAEDKVSLMDGLCIYVRIEGETIVIANFGSHDELELVVAAIVYQHNRAAGFE